MHGEGAFDWPSGKHYEGSWKDNQIHGKGHLWYPNGDEYVGEFINGKK